MSSDNILHKVKKLRELTGVGFKDCKNAMEENKGDIEKSIEFLRKKGIAKANKKMERVAADGLICICEKENKFSIIEINTETDFAAKNNEFIKFAEEISDLALVNSGKMDDILVSEMKNKRKVKDNLISLISKIGEKITFRRSDFIESGKFINFSYTHSALKKNVGKIGVLVSIESKKFDEKIDNFGHKLAMHIAATNPLAVDVNNIDEVSINKEKELINEELKNSGKDTKIIEKISKGKLEKYKQENTLLNQYWVMDPKKRVKEVIAELGIENGISIRDFIRYKVGE